MTSKLLQVSRRQDDFITSKKNVPFISGDNIESRGLFPTNL